MHDPATAGRSLRRPHTALPEQESGEDERGAGGGAVAGRERGHESHGGGRLREQQQWREEEEGEERRGDGDCCGRERRGCRPTWCGGWWGEEGSQFRGEGDRYAAPALSFSLPIAIRPIPPSPHPPPSPKPLSLTSLQKTYVRPWASPPLNTSSCNRRKRQACTAVPRTSCTTRC